MFSDSMVLEFFGRSQQSLSPDHGANHNDQSLLNSDYRSDTTTLRDGTFVPGISSNGADVQDVWRDGNVDYCGPADDCRIYPIAESNSVGRLSSFIPHAISFQTNADVGDSLTEIDDRVASSNGDVLSALSFTSATPAADQADDTEVAGLWKRFNTGAWHTEQQKLKEMSSSRESPDRLEVAGDDQLPDLSSSNRLSVAALRLYDSIYSGQAAVSAPHVVPPSRSLSSAWSYSQEQYPSHAADQPPSAVSVQKSERGPGPCPAIHRAVEAERHTKASDAYDPGMYASGHMQSSMLGSGHSVQPMSESRWSAVSEEKSNLIRGSGGETFATADDARPVAEQIKAKSDLPARKTYGADSSRADNFRWRTSATAADVFCSRTDAEDAVLVRRPSIKELKSRFEPTDTSRNVPVQESGRHAAYQSEVPSLKGRSWSLRGHSTTESGQTDQQKTNSETGSSNVVASASSYRSSKNVAAPKGQFVTRSSVAVNFPLSGIDQSEYRQIERLVDRRKIFEAADTQPVA